MSSNVTRRLVIDACVARAAGGEDATHPVSRNCRDFLHVMLGLSHQIVRTEEIWAEWKKHKSAYANIWLNSMIARKRVHSLKVEPDKKLREFVNSPPVENDAEQMLKDCHLIEAAAASDRVVVSKDVVARKLFSKASKSVGWLKMVAWVDPADQTEDPLVWLTSGAAPEESRCLNCLGS